MTSVSPGPAHLSRRSLGRLTLLGFGAAGMAQFLTGCSSSPDPNASTPATGVWPNDQPSVVVAMTASSEPSAGFNPVFGWGCGEHVHEPLIQSTLITTDAEMGFVNDLATDYSASDDGLTWDFTIRDDVKFSDGSPLTAGDVAFTINKIRTSTGAVADLTMVTEAVATDETHVSLTLSKPFNALLYTLAVVGIVPEAGYTDSYGEQPIGSGRYLLEQWDRGQQAIFVRNPTYYGDVPQMARVVVVFLDEDASLAGARSGQIDIVYTSAIYSKQEIAGYQLQAVQSVDSRGISLPTVALGGTRTDDGLTYEVGNDVTSDLAVRRAIFYALDRQALNDGVLNGYGTPAYNVSDGMPWASDDLRYSRDIEKAKKLLAEAGWVDNGGVVEKDGRKAAITLLYPSTDSTRQGLAAEFANQMKEIGIKVDYLGKSWDEIYTRQYADPIVWGWGSNSPSEMYNLYYSTGWGNFASYDNPTIDAHLDAALANPKVEDSFDDWKKAQWDGTNGVGVEGAASWLWMSNIDHLYFARVGLDIGQQKLHPHGHGWSLVNNVDEWTWR